MADQHPTGLTPETLRTWLDDLGRLDPELANIVNARAAQVQPFVPLSRGLTPEGVAPDSLDVSMVIETMVRPGRPVLPIKGDTVVREPSFIEPPDGELMVRRLLGAADKINPVIPLVGRIDVANFPRTANFIGTGWLIDEDVIVTNSHVAELIGRRDGRGYSFLPGRFGDPIIKTVNWKREMDGDGGEASAIEDIIFIESRKKADIAFLKIKRRTDGTVQNRIVPAQTDAPPGTDVVVIGYPARGGPDVIDDQVWMEKVFSGRYDVKRAAPGMVMPNKRGWACHDCTTLGGNSGSAVIDLKTGEAVALHFAGEYIITNYAVPASVINRYIKQRPWNPIVVDTAREESGGEEQEDMISDKAGKPQSANEPAHSSDAGGQASVSITLPLTITFSVGSPAAAVGSASHAVSVEMLSFDEAMQRFAQANKGGGILGVRSGLVIRNGEFTDVACICVLAHPEKIDAVRARCPSNYFGHPVEVRAAGVAEMLSEGDFIAEAAVTSIAYNDDERTGANYSFDEVSEPMEVLCCVGPERSWTVLSNFVANAEGRMVSSIYEFHAAHIADAIEARLGDGVKMALAMDNATRVNKAGVKKGDFDRKSTFKDWAARYDFERIYVPEGGSGLVANSYHIKVTVDDADRFWLSSGNWKNSSQPNIAAADLNSPSRIKSYDGNREWHVVIKNKALAGRFRNHILADIEFSQANGGKEESVAEDIFVDVPIALEESVALEARAAGRIVEPLKLNRAVKVKPLLTPDQKGRVYSEAVLDLIRSAEEQLLFQIPYIDSYKPSAKGYLDKLVKALVKKSKEIDDVRVILRSNFSAWVPCAEDLKKRGLNLRKCLRHVPGTHTKGMIVDGQRVLVGSHNWSGGGVTLNRDASLLFDDAEIATYYRDVFEIDWDRASHPIIRETAIAEAPRLAEPGSPVAPGFRRMSLEEFLEG